MKKGQNIWELDVQKFREKNTNRIMELTQKRPIPQLTLEVDNLQCVYFYIILCS